MRSARWAITLGLTMALALGARSSFAAPAYSFNVNVAFKKDANARCSGKEDAIFTVSSGPSNSCSVDVHNDTQGNPNGIYLTNCEDSVTTSNFLIDAADAGHRWKDKNSSVGPATFDYNNCAKVNNPPTLTPTANGNALSFAFSVPHNAHCSHFTLTAFDNSNSQICIDPVVSNRPSSNRTIGMPVLVSLGVIGLTIVLSFFSIFRDMLKRG